MKRLFCVALSLFLAGTTVLYAQEETSFTIIYTPGDSLRAAGNLMAAIEAYKSNVSAGNTYPPGDNSVARSIYFADSYNITCVLSRVGQQDSALKYLKQAVVDCQDISGEALSDPDLIGLRKASGWPQLENLIISNYCRGNNITIKDLEYAKTLWYMGAKDQAYYKDIELAEAKIGKSSSVVMALWDLKRIINEENQSQMEALIQKKGWPKISDVGTGPANTAFLIMQHADLKLQQKYLPLLESLCKKGEAQWQQYALMYDRIQTDLGKPQRYGSQVTYNSKSAKYELLLLESPSNVDEWRENFGMQPLSEYLETWKIAWPSKE
jgi:hypothetical protein